ncbi:MAG: alpha/beta hydrolase [Chloroflexota bacterium]
MDYEEYTAASDDGLALFGRLWRPPGSARGVICLVHGIGEHSGRWSHVGAAVAAAGFAVLAQDLRGHGRSAGRRGHTPSFEVLMDDIATLLSEAERRFPGLPRCLYGHSLGGNLVLNHALRRQHPTIVGVIATGPWLRLAFEPPAWKVTLAKLLNDLWPSFGMGNGLDRSALSRDPQVEHAYATDPLVHDRITTRLYVSCAAAGRWALEHAADMRVPTLLMHGGQDRLSSLTASRDFAAATNGACSLKVWDSLYHELHNEPEQQQVLAVVFDWINVLLAGTEPPRPSDRFRGTPASADEC